MNEPTEIQEPSLNDLMKKVDLTDREVEKIVLALRKARESFRVEEVSAKKAGRKVQSKAAKKPVSLTLDDLEKIKF